MNYIVYKASSKRKTKLVLILSIILMSGSMLSCKNDKTKSTENDSKKDSTLTSTPKKATTAFDYVVKDILIQKPDVTNHVRVFQKEGNNGEYISIIPSLGRGVEDYTEKYKSTITSSLVDAGYTVVLIQPRGIGKSTGDLTPGSFSLKDMAHDIKSCLDSLGITKINLVGHAFGNRVARTYATMYTDHVDKLMLLACGGNSTLDPEAEKCLKGSFDLNLPDQERVKMLGCAFFAKGSDPSVWLHGWYPPLAIAEMQAAKTIDPNYFKKAGGKKFLVVQALEDFVAPPDEAGKALRDALPNQVTYKEVAHVGHALTSEQPKVIAELMLDYLNSK